MNTRFPDAMKGALLGTILISANLEKVNPAIVEEIKTEFINDLPMPSSFQQEVYLSLNKKHDSNINNFYNSCNTCIASHFSSDC